MRPRPARLFAALLFAALLVPPLATLVGRAAESPGFTVAVLRRDGVLIPFASFDGNRWVNRWPAEHAVNVPIGLADVPKDWWPNKTVAVNWKAFPLAGGSQPLKVIAPALVYVHCIRRVGLRTDYTAIEPPPPPLVQPYPKNGLAVAGDVVVEPIEIVKLDSPEAAAVLESLKPPVAEAESKTVQLWSRRWTHPLGAKDRAKTPLSFEVLARTPGLEPGASVYYFEGIKKYAGFSQYAERAGKLDKVMCDYLTFAGGWFLAAPKAEASKAVVGAELSNCNRQGLVYTLPLGAIRTAGRLFWIVQTSSWDFERYEVIEIKAKETKSVLSVGGGGCPEQ